VSLIFEALKKLEREKEAPDRGLVVVAPGTWGEGEKRSRGRTVTAVALLALGLGLGAFALRTGTRIPEPPAPAARSTPKAVAAITSPEPAPVTSRAATDETPPPPVTERLVVPTVPPPRAPRDAATKPAEPTATTTPEPELRLNAISSRDGMPVALLNDRLVREGDVVDGIRVLRIGEDHVEVEWKGERRILRF
jgi:hypothetical protein